MDPVGFRRRQALTRTHHWCVPAALLWVSSRRKPFGLSRRLMENSESRGIQNQASPYILIFVDVLGHDANNGREFSHSNSLACGRRRESCVASSVASSATSSAPTHPTLCRSAKTRLTFTHLTNDYRQHRVH